ncbi:MAG: lipopolysaccharide heptosyltransferase II [Acidobacteria bacterium]|nr:lipopolysaccharide heptosyltransferase II [Acidobacteriota bacterium]
MSESIQRLVVRPPNWLGDAVLALPALGAVRRHFASAHLTIAATPSVAALFREDTNAAPDRVVELPAGTRDAVAVLEGEGFELGLLFPNSFRSAWQLFRARIPQRWGYARSWRRLLLTHRSAPARREGVTHQSDYYRDLVRGLGIECAPSEAPRVEARLPSIARADALLAQMKVAPEARFVGFAPGAAYGQAKQWPPDRVAAVIAALVRQARVTPVLVGASHDRDAALAVESWLRAHAADVVPAVVNLTGRTSLGALAGVVQRMSAFVSNDSGAMHLAAAIGLPVVAIFGPTDERATSPIGDHDVITEPVFCRPCHLRDCPIDHRCMKRIDVDVVYRAVVARLAAAGR